MHRTSQPKHDRAPGPGAGPPRAARRPRRGADAAASQDDRARDYWSALAPDAVFAHPVDAARLGRWVPKDARVLDVGCGWGRTLAELSSAGWERLTGVDFAQGMIERGRAENPVLDLRLADGRSLPFDARSFDVVLLFAVLTTIPRDADQTALVAEVRRVLAPGGVVYVSDLLLNADPRNVQRYDAARPFGLGPHGCFRLDDGGVCRHHDPEWIDALFGEFEMLEWWPFTATTMRGHTSRAFQLLARARGAAATAAAARRSGGRRGPR